MRRLGPAALAALVLIVAAPPGASASAPADGAELCRVPHTTLFSCRIRSGEQIALCLRRARSAWMVTLVDPRNGRRSELTNLAMWNSGFAHGGEAVLEAQARHARVAFFVVAGGIPDQTEAVVRDTGARSATRICREDSIRLPSTSEAGPNAPPSFFTLQTAGLARQLDDKPPWPIGRNPR